VRKVQGVGGDGSSRLGRLEAAAPNRFFSYLIKDEDNLIIRLLFKRTLIIFNLAISVRMFIIDAFLSLLLFLFGRHVGGKIKPTV
jgi:hypothetical protein